MDEEVLVARAVDRVLRPLFPPGYCFDTQVRFGPCSGRLVGSTFVVVFRLLATASCESKGCSCCMPCCSVASCCRRQAMPCAGIASRVPVLLRLTPAVSPFHRYIGTGCRHRAGVRAGGRSRGGRYQRGVGGPLPLQYPLGWTGGLRTNR